MNVMKVRDEAKAWVRAICGDPVAKKLCELRGIEVKGNVEGLNTAGGFLSPDQFLATYIPQRDLVGIARRYATVYEVKTDSGVVPRRTSGLTASLVNEATAIAEGQSAWDTLGFVLQKAAVMTKVTRELEEDADVLLDFLVQEFAFAMARLEDDFLINGDGLAGYNGFVGLKNRSPIGAGQFAGYVDAASGNDTFAEVTAADLASIVAKLPTWALDNARWYCSQVAFAQVFCRLAAGAGGIGRSANGLPTFWGFEIVRSNLFPTTTGDLSDTPMLYFGDLSQAAYLANRRDLAVARSDSRFLDQDLVAYKATARWDFSLLVGDATTAGNIIALVGE